MADETAMTAPVDAPAPAVASEPEKPTETPNTNGETVTIGEKEEDSEAAAEHAKVEEPAVHGEKTEQPEASSSEPAADSTPATSGKDKKRKSTGGVPEHKNKKLNKKKSMPSLHLDCKPGEFYWARLKGYPPWPAIICDEEMLPESLLATRPVSTSRPDGTLRDDFKEGGKNAKERTFPIMFLATNEFQWMVNTALTPLEPEECLKLPTTKMTKALQEAYQIASEGHDINYFKGILKLWQEEQEAFRIESERLAEEAERKAAEKAAKAEEDAALAEEGEKKAKKKAPRKSKAADEDVDMVDADAPKSTKKRKKETESDADAPKVSMTSEAAIDRRANDLQPKKTPKVMKLNAPKTPNSTEAASAKKSTSKPKKKVVSAPKAEDDDEKPQMTEAERLAQREKAVLYLRHRLQKGFLSRDQAPKEDEMAAMADFFAQLESYETLEPSIIRQTKIHKVLKAIVKLASVPKDDEYGFKKRSTMLLDVWNKRMEADGGDAPPPAAVEKEKPAPAAEEKAPHTNGSKEAEPEKEAQKEVLDEAKKDAEEGAAKPVENQEIEMKDAEASEKPAETAEEKKAEVAAAIIQQNVEAPKTDAPQASAENGADEAGDVGMQTAPA
ncbi:uncharacterized protein MYCFIDRAFT_198959 [Pseudocercospora fijiensis CIRAD86]|uniref:PWWP domain-containing protein n=1 Tax=Pseudocercospora fijiensis (strain CIRAD86) TaxID=383855 RepID=M3APN9_PSEFD|nr:uncharacterized protein MYCFIDRAFT_198959 [Pseudocercospora fijiensis CIRAD86]EME79093.1 hypothetical protein MYCFIDRAFT_198959 [Pseudocercospora fijiensis CIRAD86]